MIVSMLYSVLLFASSVLGTITRSEVQLDLIMTHSAFAISRQFLRLFQKPSLQSNERINISEIRTYYCPMPPESLFQVLEILQCNLLTKCTCTVCSKGKSHLNSKWRKLSNDAYFINCINSFFSLNCINQKSIQIETSFYCDFIVKWERNNVLLPIFTGLGVGSSFHLPSRYIKPTKSTNKVKIEDKIAVESVAMNLTSLIPILNKLFRERINGNRIYEKIENILPFGMTPHLNLLFCTSSQASMNLVEITTYLCEKTESGSSKIKLLIFSLYKLIEDLHKFQICIKRINFEEISFHLISNTNVSSNNYLNQMDKEGIQITLKQLPRSSNLFKHRADTNQSYDSIFNLIIRLKIHFAQKGIQIVYWDLDNFLQNDRLKNTKFHQFIREFKSMEILEI